MTVNQDVHVVFKKVWEQIAEPLKLFLKMIFPTRESLPQVIWHDNNCKVQSMLQKDQDFYFKNCTMPVDVFHFKSKHKESNTQCNPTCNPAKWKELQTSDGKWRFNSSAAEQANIWFGGYQAIVREMEAIRYDFYLDEMIKQHNQHQHQPEARNKGGTASTYAPSPNDSDNEDMSSVDDKSTPRPLQRLSRPPSRPHSAAARSRHTPYPPIADRNDPLSSENQLSAPFFSPDATYLPSQHAEGSAIPLTASASGQWSNYPETEWTGTAPTPSGSWGQDDTSMSDVRSALASPDDPDMDGVEDNARPPEAEQQEQPQRRKTAWVKPQPLPSAPIVPFQRAGPPPRLARSSLRPPARRIEARGGRKPPPAPIPAATYAATASRAPSASQAKAVNLVQLARAARAASPQAIIRIHEEQSGQAKSTFTSHGPSRNQVLVQFGGEARCPSSPFATVQREVNKALIQQGCTRRVQSVENAHGGWSLKTNGVAQPVEIDFIRGAIMSGVKNSNP
ncbi:hypothetical protein EST38_g13072 [Candolleomyces aberdarensis]|uniref:Uncharacterized protein n=1 Tax=Candolleomyces aberdarensis TaxID=2316362 RepID=A0A4Q2D206_9AGAR|nr:hypothetical protein EST38_g13072 [Candolleomyces aberdarensis]